MNILMSPMVRGCSRPQKLAFQYLEELASEFSRLYGTQVDSVARPYAFIKFGEPVSMTGRLSPQVQAGPVAPTRACIPTKLCHASTHLYRM